jgi:hypothetical protein
MAVNRQAGSARYGQAYTVQRAPGGAWHIYPNGKRVFVRAGTPHPQAPAPIPTSTPAPAQLAPDSDYFTGQGQRVFDVSQRLAGIDEDQRVDRSNYDEALRRLADNQRQSVKNTTEGHNRQGLFYSGQLGQALGDSAKEYARQRADSLMGLQAREAARANARRALESGATADEAAAYAAALDRQIGRDTTAADANSLVVNPAPAAPAAPAVTPRPAARPSPRSSLQSRTPYRVAKRRRPVVRRNR